MSSAAATALTVALLACCCYVQPSAAVSFWDSQFSTSEYAQFQHKGQFMVTIFQHLTKESTFYITPLVLLDHRSGSVRFNPLTEFWELRFDVIMWDSELQAGVADFLRAKGISHPDVKMLPMEKVRFDWRSRSRPMKKSVVMEGEFMATHHLPRLLTLTFACRNQTECELVKRNIRMDPEMLDSLVLDCFMTTQKSATKIVNVTTENLMKSPTFSKLLLLPPDGNFRYMRAEDFSSMVRETYSSVRATTIRSSEYVEKYDELNIMKLIEDALKSEEVAAASLSETRWNSVFWDPTFARPDRVVREASRTFKKDEATGKLRVDKAHLANNEEARRLFTSSSSSTSGRVSGSFLLFRASASAGSSSSHQSTDESSRRTAEQDSFSSDELNQMLREANHNVEWNGERFVVKPMNLVSVNQMSYKSKRQLASNSMQLTIYQQTISLKVIVTPEHNETSLVKEAAKKSEFPTQYSYCLLSNGGACPPGFTRSSGFMKSVRLDTTSEGMIQKAALGDSAIKCHSPGDSDNCEFKGWEPYKGELHLHVCCR